MIKNATSITKNIIVVYNITFVCQPYHITVHLPSQPLREMQYIDEVSRNERVFPHSLELQHLGICCGLGDRLAPPVGLVPGIDAALPVPNLVSRCQFKAKTSLDSSLDKTRIHFCFEDSWNYMFHCLPNKYTEELHTVVR